MDSSRPGGAVNATSLISVLTLLAPNLVEATLDGRQPEGMTLPGLMVGVAVEWGEQTERHFVNQG